MNDLGIADLFERDPFSPKALSMPDAAIDGGTWRLEIPGEPSAWGRGSPVVINGHARILTPKKTRSFQSTVREIAGRAWQRAPIADRPIFMRATFTRVVPSSWSHKKRIAALAGHLWPTSKPDLDNYVKSIKDALNELVYVDDRLIVASSERKVFGEIPGSLIELAW